MPVEEKDPASRASLSAPSICRTPTPAQISGRKDAASGLKSPSITHLTPLGKFDPLHTTCGWKHTASGGGSESNEPNDRPTSHIAKTQFFFSWYARSTLTSDVGHFLYFLILKFFLRFEFCIFSSVFCSDTVENTDCNIFKEIVSFLRHCA